MRTYGRGCTTERVAGVVGVAGLFLGTNTIWIISSPDIGLNDLPKPTFWRISRFSTNDRVMM
jgi:hypothetical protein